MRTLLFWQLFVPTVIAAGGLAWLVSQAAKRLRWRWIRLRLRKELQALDLVGIARQRLP